MEKDQFFQKFLGFIDEKNLLADVKTIIAAVSGGVDSMVMLFWLNTIQVDKDFRLIVAHFNHLYRGDLALADENLVFNWCKQKNLEIMIERENVKDYALKNKISFEMAGRELRYKFFNRIAGQYKHSKIATAHIASDHSETVLLRIVRGTGLRGLQGIRPQSQNFIRPVLFAKKNELYSYAKLHGIPFSDDHTNFENDCQRNLVRNQVMPLLLKINPQIHNSISRLSEIVTMHDDLIRQITDQQITDTIINTKKYMIELDLKHLLALAVAVRNEIIFRAIRLLDIEVTEQPSFFIIRQIENLMIKSETGKFIRIFEKIIVLKNRNRLSMFNEEMLQWKERVIEPGKIYNTDSFLFSSEYVNFGNFSANDNSKELIDAGKIKGRLTLRHWHKGDRMIPLGGHFFKKLSDIFIDSKMSRFEKFHTPVLVDEEKIIWVCGKKLSDQVKVNNKTKNYLKIEFKEIENVR